MEYWFYKNKKKCIFVSLRFLPEYFNVVRFKTNKAKKGIDKLFELNIQALGFYFSYMDFDY